MTSFKMADDVLKKYHVFASVNSVCTIQNDWIYCWVLFDLCLVAQWLSINAYIVYQNYMNVFDTFQRVMMKFSFRV